MRLKLTMKSSMDVVTLGMCNIDDIYYPIPRKPVLDIIGGAGTYAILGARIMKCSGEGLGWTVHTGSDFPEEMWEEFNSWNTECNFIDTPERLTTRGVNSYKSRESEKRDFEYGTPKIRIDHNTLTDAQLTAKVFHMICSPSRCIELIKGITTRRAQIEAEGGSAPRPLLDPIFVWEPVPDACTYSEMRMFLEALEHVDVMSPNLGELESLLGQTFTTESGEPNIQKLNQHCRVLLSPYTVKKVKAVIVRMSEFGSQVIQKERSVHIDAYHQPFSASKTQAEKLVWKNKIIDPTGAGNAYLGGFCIGLLINDGLFANLRVFERAAIYGSVAASFAVEQIGVPILTPARNHKAEKWNGEHALDRLSSYQIDQTSILRDCNATVGRWKEPPEWTGRDLLPEELINESRQAVLPEELGSELGSEFGHDVLPEELSNESGRESLSEESSDDYPQRCQD